MFRMYLGLSRDLRLSRVLNPLRERRLHPIRSQGPKIPMQASMFKIRLSLAPNQVLYRSPKHQSRKSVSSQQTQEYGHRLYLSRFRNPDPFPNFPSRELVSKLTMLKPDLGRRCQRLSIPGTAFLTTTPKLELHPHHPFPGHFLFPTRYRALVPRPRAPKLE